MEALLQPGGELRTLVLTGEAGIGKSALWEAGLAAARRAGVRVLAARPDETEVSLSFSALADLLDGIRAAELGAVPAPQRIALETAILRREPAGAPPDPFAVAAGFRSALHTLSQAAPVLVAVDDFPWLDAESAQALGFAARRLRDCPVRFLLSERSGGTGSGVGKAFGPVERLRVQPLSYGAARLLLTERFGTDIPRRTLRRVVDSAGGNPLFMIELLRAGVAGPVDEELAIPDSLDDVFGPRVVALEEPVGRALLAVALGGSVRRPELLGLVDAPDLERAEELELLVDAGGVVRASHPLLAAAARRHASAADRQRLHSELAHALQDEVAAARHLALATPSADPRVAALATGAAGVAAARGAVLDARALADQALRLTPRADPTWSERLLAVAEYTRLVGDRHPALDVLDRTLQELPTANARARAELLLSEWDELDATDERLQRALDQSVGDAALRANVLATRALLLAIARVAHLAEAERTAAEAISAAVDADPQTRGRAASSLAWARIMRGLSIDDLRALADGEPGGGLIADSSIDRPAAVRHAFRGEQARALATLRQLQETADERAEAISSAVLTLQRCELALRAGDLPAAARLHDELLEWDDLGLAQWRPGRRRCEALLAALRGEPERAESIARQVLRKDGPPGFMWNMLEAHRARGIAALVGHRPETARAELCGVWEYTLREGIDDPGAFPVAADLVEALVELARLDEAKAVLDVLRERAAAQEHPWAQAAVLRCNGSLAFAEGDDLDQAEAQVTAAAARYAELGLGFDAARSWLLLGRGQRRGRRWAKARETLERAATAFAEMGAPGWLREARSELSRVGGRKPAAAGGLSSTERQVADLAAAGRSNKEIAAALHVTVHTVEKHLSRAYAKLGITSRGQLAQRLP